MVRSMPSRGGRPLAPTAPTRRQVQASLARDIAGSESTGEASPSTGSTARQSALERRQALTVSGKAALLKSGSVSGGRIRSHADRRRPTPQQPGRMKRGESRTSVAVNLSRTSLPWSVDSHPLTDQSENERLKAYELEVKGRFDRIVPLLKQVSALQHEPDFLAQAQRTLEFQLGVSASSAWACGPTRRVKNCR